MMTLRKWQRSAGATHFHKWDLTERTDAQPTALGHLLWVFSLLGLVTSVSGIWIGWKRLRR